MTGDVFIIKGIIVLNKPKGKTSHNMISFMRRLTGIKRIGHTGTLDPDATGVLPICIGKATRASAYITAEDKHYRATVVLGSSTDTYDASGRVTGTSEVLVSENDIKSAIAYFVGEQEQVPPMYSAIKVGGRKLYELARKGESVEIAPRRITIYSIDVIDIDLEIKIVTIDVHCSKGTYIRSLCADIGLRLGCLAHMGSLVRTYPGSFSIEDCYTVEQLEQMSVDGRLIDAVISLDVVFKDYGRLDLTAEEELKVRNGMQIAANGAGDSLLYRLYDSDGKLLCLSKVKDSKLVMETSFWD